MVDEARDFMRVDLGAGGDDSSALRLHLVGCLRRDFARTNLVELDLLTSSGHFCGSVIVMAINNQVFGVDLLTDVFK